MYETSCHFASHLHFSLSDKFYPDNILHRLELNYLLFFLFFHSNNSTSLSICNLNRYHAHRFRSEFLVDGGIRAPMLRDEGRPIRHRVKQWPKGPVATSIVVRIKDRRFNVHRYNLYKRNVAISLIWLWNIHIHWFVSERLHIPRRFFRTEFLCVSLLFATERALFLEMQKATRTFVFSTE